MVAYEVKGIEIVSECGICFIFCEFEGFENISLFFFFNIFSLAQFFFSIARKNHITTTSEESTQTEGRDIS